LKTVAIIQARMGSTRLPRKVLRVLAGETVLGHVVHRAQAVARIDEVVVATTTAPADDAIVAEASRLGVRATRGSEDDVLDRYYQAAKVSGAERIVRITSDCPLLDPGVVDAMLAQFDALAAAGTPVDYLSNSVTRRFPRGLDAEIFGFDVLARAHAEAHAPAEREHVTPYFYRHPERFSIAQHAPERDLSQHRWTLDTEDDWRFLEAVFGHLGHQVGGFGTEDVLTLLERHPEIFRLNAHIEQKALGH